MHERSGRLFANISIRFTTLGAAEVPHSELILQYKDNVL